MGALTPTANKKTCCFETAPSLTVCVATAGKDGLGPYAVSTGGDYPDAAEQVCDATAGCVAFGQMYSYVSRFHFESAAACKASQAAGGAASLGEYHCEGGGEGGEPIAYRSSVPMEGKAPYTCYTTANL